MYMHCNFHGCSSFLHSATQWSKKPHLRRSSPLFLPTHFFALAPPYLNLKSTSPIPTLAP